MLCTSGKSEKVPKKSEFEGGDSSSLEVKSDQDGGIDDQDPKTESDLDEKRDDVKFGLNVDSENCPFSDYVDRLSISEDVSSANNDEQEAEIEVSGDLLVQYMRKNDVKRLKLVLRNSSWGVRHELRQRVWKDLCKHRHKADDHEVFSEFLEELFPEGDHSEQDLRVPMFIDFDFINNYHLTTDGVLQLKKILNVLEHYNPDIVYCPLLYSVVAVFLHYQNESDCYNSVYALLRCKNSSRFLTHTKVAYDASKFVIRDLAKKYAKSGYVYLVRQSSSVDSAFDPWFRWIFEDLPFSYLLRVMDCYLLEGMKVLYRVALAIIILYSKTHTKKTTASPKQEKGQGVQNIRQFCREIPVKIDKLLKTGFSIRGLTRKEIYKLQLKNEMFLTSVKHIQSGNDMVNKMSMSRSFSGPIILQNTGSNMLKLDMLFTIWTWLPKRYAVCQPTLLYTSEEHGTSLVTLYQMIEDHQPTVIVIKSTTNEIFGAFCSAYWKERRKQKGPHLSYFGTGESFVFTLTPEKKKYDWVGLTEENIPNTANMFMAGDRSILTIGGGHGGAIQLDETFLHCRTEKCDTFNNEPLCSTEDFTCKVVEVYGFQ